VCSLLPRETFVSPHLKVLVHVNVNVPDEESCVCYAIVLLVPVFPSTHSTGPIYPVVAS
jgi:hypothetical protein